MSEEATAVGGRAGPVGRRSLVHLGSEPERLPVFRDAVGEGRLEPGYAADDGAALVFAGGRLQRCVASGPDARVLRIAPDGRGGVRTEEMTVEVLAAVEHRGPAEPEPYGVSELRALRAGRNRWD